MTARHYKEEKYSQFLCLRNMPLGWSKQYEVWMIILLVPFRHPILVSDLSKSTTTTTTTSCSNFVILFVVLSFDAKWTFWIDIRDASRAFVSGNFTGKISLAIHFYVPLIFPPLYISWTRNKWCATLVMIQEISKPFLLFGCKNCFIYINFIFPKGLIMLA